MAKLNAFEIQIPLTDTQKTLVSMWLERFHVRSVHIWSTPKLQDSVLIIHPADLTNLLSFAEPGDCSEFEFYRLRKLGASAIESTLSSEKSKASQDLRSMTLAALEGLVPESRVSVPFQELILPDTI